MNSHVTERFRASYDALPQHIRRQARAAYVLFRQNPHHPGLRFKRVHAARSIYSVRITDDYRALGTLTGEDIVWFWIGSHADYDTLVARL